MCCAHGFASIWGISTIVMVCGLVKRALDDGKQAAEVDEDEVIWDMALLVLGRYQQLSGLQAFERVAGQWKAGSRR